MDICAPGQIGLTAYLELLQLKLNEFSCLGIIIQHENWESDEFLMITFGARQAARPHQIRFHLPLTPEASVSPILRHKHHFHFLEKSLAPSRAKGVVTSSFKLSFSAVSAVSKAHTSMDRRSLKYFVLFLLEMILGIQRSLTNHNCEHMLCIVRSVSAS